MTTQLDEAGQPAPTAASRRRFLKTTILGAAGAGLAPAAFAQEAAETSAIPESMKTPGADTAANPYGLPSAHESHVVRKLSVSKQAQSSSSRTPLEQLDGILTPNGLFYERHHGGVPDIDPAEHKVMIYGLVEKPLIFTMADLRRFPSVNRIHVLECSGNQNFSYKNKVTAGDIMGLVSCAEWTGVPLRTILEEAGVKPEAKWVVAEGADASGMTRSIPLEKCLDDVLLVYSQNGERLRPEQGYPVRIFVPGYEGNMSVKWLRSLQVRDEPIYSREETSKYTDLMPDGKAREFTFVMEAKSIITFPSGGQKIDGAGFYEISGLAWSGSGKIARVEVSTDNGATWTEAKLQEPVLSICMTRFRHAWQWDGKPTTIMSRAIDETGYVQPDLQKILEVRGKNSTYHNHAIQPWNINDNGEVSNALA